MLFVSSYLRILHKFLLIIDRVMQGQRFGHEISIMIGLTYLDVPVVS